MRRRLLAIAATAAMAIPIAACDSKPATPAPRGSSAPLFNLLPAKYQQSKVILVGSNFGYPPFEYYAEDGKTPQGFDVELADLLSKQLGVTLQFHNADFDGLITELGSGRSQIIISGMSDTKERQQKVDFVDYYRAGGVLITNKGNPKGLKTLTDLCGQTIAVQRGTTAEDLGKKQSDKCVADGKGKIEVLAFDEESQALIQIKQKRAVSGIEDYPVAAYNARTAGGGKDFEVVGDQVDAGPLGIAVPKSDTGLRDAILAALNAAIASGEYQALVKKYEMPAGAVTKAGMNEGT